MCVFINIHVPQKFLASSIPRECFDVSENCKARGQSILKRPYLIKWIWVRWIGIFEGSKYETFNGKDDFATLWQNFVGSHLSHDTKCNNNYNYLKKY